MKSSVILRSDLFTQLSCDVGDVMRDLDEGRQVKGFLASLLTNDNFNVQDIYANVSELMFAGVDTVSGVFGAVVCL